jgi:hypothetical protein
MPDNRAGDAVSPGGQEVTLAIRAAEAALVAPYQGLTGALATLTLAALEHPWQLGAATIDRCARLLTALDLPDGAHDAACLTIAAMTYAVPHLIGPDVAARLAGVLAGPAPSETHRRASLALTGLLVTPAADVLVDRLLELLARPDGSPEQYDALMRALERVAAWTIDRLDLPRLVGLAERAYLAAHREALLHGPIERVALAAPEQVTVGLLDRLAALYEDTPSFGYLLAHLAARPAASASVRAVATAGTTGTTGTTGRLPLREAVRHRLGGPAARVLVVQNIADGQGGEIIRTVPLLQALLDLNPRLRASVVTMYPYLYAHPRIEIVPLGDRERIGAVLGEPFDAVFDSFEPRLQSLNHDRALEALVQRHVAACPPFLFAASARGRGSFLYERLTVDGQACAEGLGLDRLRVPSVYETTYRLLVHLGLPVRLGEEPPASEPVLAGLPSPTAEAAWAALLAGNAEGRPVALVNPFGGGDALTGYTEETADVLVRRLRRLIEAGYFLVLLPNGEPWGGPSAARAIVEGLAPAEQRFVALGPDPAAHDGQVTCDGLGDLLVPYASAQMRLATSFVRYADLVVTVEGWMVHAAYLLGKRFEIVKTARSQSERWHPYGRSPRQGATLAPVPPTAPTTSLLAAPPLPDRPRLDVLTFLVRELPLLADDRVIPALRWATLSRDIEVRQAGAEALAALGDSSPRPGPRAAPAVASQPQGAPTGTFVGPPGTGTILVLTPLKDATPFFDGYVQRLMQVIYPHTAISLGFLEGDSTDGTFELVQSRLPELRSAFRRVGLWKRDFGYRLPPGMHRGAAPIQIERRIVLAKSRNHLLFHALDDEEWVLWLDVDIVAYPPDLLQRLLAAGKEIVQPHCVLDPGGPTFDTNGWRDRGRLHLDDLRTEGELVALDAVGGTVLLVRADLHRDGLLFPAYLYGRESPWMRAGRGEVETEGLGIMARDMGYRAWGLPHLEVIHARS